MCEYRMLCKAIRTYARIGIEVFQQQSFLGFMYEFASVEQIERPQDHDRR